MISVISVVSGPTLRSRVRRHDHYGEWYGSEQDVLSLTLLTTLTVSAAWCSVVGILSALGLAANLHNNRGGSENCRGGRLFNVPVRGHHGGPGEILIETKT